MSSPLAPARTRPVDVNALLARLTARDPHTARHSVAVARYAGDLAVALGASDEERRLVHTAGLLHDVGKLILPDSILRAGRGLSEDDWELVHRHPVAGAELVAQVPGCGEIAEAIRHHHERIDGAGYPDGLIADEIPWMARVISVADAYDAMTARGSYKRPRTMPDAVVELRRVAGAQLDARFVDVFIGRLVDPVVAPRRELVL